MSETHYQLDQLADSVVPRVATGGVVPVSDRLDQLADSVQVLFSLWALDLVFGGDNIFVDFTCSRRDVQILVTCKQFMMG
jgi:hypothetical protein